MTTTAISFHFKNSLNAKKLPQQTMNKRTQQKRIEARLKGALLKDGALAHALYEYELVEHIDYWYQQLIEDKNDFLFVVTENRGDVAMLLIEPDKKVYINEEGRAKLKQLWPDTYTTNIKRLIPGMAEDLADNIMSVNGVSTANMANIVRFLKQAVKNFGFKRSPS